MTAPKSPPVSNSTIGRCAAFRCASRSGPKTWKKAASLLARRDIPGKAGKSFVPQTDLAAQVDEMLEQIHSSLYDRALAFRQANTLDPHDLRRAGRSRSERLGLFLVVRKRRMRSEGQRRHQGDHPLHAHSTSPKVQGKCIVCGEPAKRKVYLCPRLLISCPPSNPLC